MSEQQTGITIGDDLKEVLFEIETIASHLGVSPEQCFSMLLSVAKGENKASIIQFPGKK